MVSKGISMEHAKQIIDKVKAANLLIAEIDRGLEIGHSYFCHTVQCDDFYTWWEDICEYELFPYIREVCFDDDDKCGQICNKLKF